MNIPPRERLIVALDFPDLASAERLVEKLDDSVSIYKIGYELALVKEGAVDAASIDCVTWAFAGDHAPELTHGVRILSRTPPSPAIPFVTSIGTAPDLVRAPRRALVTIGTAPAYRAVRAPLRLASIGLFPLGAYASLLRYKEEAVAAGYPQLA